MQASPARAFVAVNMTDELRAQVEAVQARLRGLGADVKWVAPEGFHLTLKFLGPVGRERLEPIARALGQATEGAEGFTVCLRGLGAYPSAKRARVIWVGVDRGQEQLRELARRVESALEPLGFGREERPFSGHLTVGRVRSPRGADALAQALETSAGEALGELLVERIALMESELRREGARYSLLGEFPLVGRQQVSSARPAGPGEAR